MTKSILEIARDCGLTAIHSLQRISDEDFEAALLSFATKLREEAKAEQPQIAWLCERGGNGPNRYVCIDPSGFFDWTEDVNKALRLCRREDADAVAAIVDDCWRVAEHQWG